jgi:hypothetical protein
MNRISRLATTMVVSGKLELGGHRRHCHQHGLPVARRSARGRAPAAAPCGSPSASAASAGALPPVERHHRPIGVRRPLSRR